jgi:HEAT repeat protein
MSRLLFGVMMIGLFASASYVKGAEVLSNDDVVSLVEAGLEIELVERKIRSSANDFDVSASAMVKLRKAGVPDRTIETMLEMAQRQQSQRENRLNMQIQYLTSERPQARQAAYLRLLEMGNRAVDRMLEILASDTDPNLRAAVARTLGRMQVERARPALEVLIESTNAEVRLAAADALGRLGEEDGAQQAVSALREWEPGQDGAPVDGYLRLAGLVDEKAASGFAVKALQQSSDPGEREEAARALGRLEAKADVTVLEHALRNDRSPAVRQAAARALARLAQPGSAEALLDVLPKDPHTRVAVIRALGSFDPARVVPGLISAMGQKLNEEEMQALLASLRRLTHQDFGPDRRRWLEWWEAHEDEL